jgi:hypothetical protein
VGLFRRECDTIDRAKQQLPRDLTAREIGWIKEILQTDEQWANSDIRHTLVVAEGPVDEGVGIQLSAPQPENSQTTSREGLIGQIWINTDDNCSINIQLSQWHGQLRELYILFVDPKHARRTLPESWAEVSHQVFRD